MGEGFLTFYNLFSSTTSLPISHGLQFLFIVLFFVIFLNWCMVNNGEWNMRSVEYEHVNGNDGMIPQGVGEWSKIAFPHYDYTLSRIHASTILSHLLTLSSLNETPLSFPSLYPSLWLKEWIFQMASLSSCGDCYVSCHSLFPWFYLVLSKVCVHIYI